MNQEQVKQLITSQIQPILQEIAKLREQLDTIKNQTRSQKTRSTALARKAQLARTASKKDEITNIMSKPIQEITDVIKRGQEDTEFRESQEYKTAVKQLDIRQRQEKLLKAQSRDGKQISDEDRKNAGYLPTPTGLSLPPALTLGTLRGNLNRVAIPIQLKHLSKANVIGSNGTNILASDLPPSIIANEDTETTETTETTEATETTETTEDADGIIPSNPDKIKDAIMCLPLSQKLSIKPEDIAINHENESEISKILNSDDVMVKPYSIPAGIVGQANVNGKECLIAFDHPNIAGQPGNLLAIFENDSFKSLSEDKPHPTYNPNDIHQ